MSRRIESPPIAGPAGRLEALLEEPDHGTPQFAALVCHPHPQHGGTMHNKVVHRLARGLRRAGAVVLRFNYRGVNLSEGEYDEGIGEVEDARAALSWLLGRYPDLPYSLAGFSFGSRIALKLGCELGHPDRIIAVGFPTVYPNREFLVQCVVPRVFIQSTNDQFGPRPDLEALVATLPEPKQLLWVEAADHFFAGALDAFEQTVYQTAK
ncbi:MAG: alpha/beta family hydrolase [Bryobacteraceae bacterium]